MVFETLDRISHHKTKFFIHHYRKKSLTFSTENHDKTFVFLKLWTENHEMRNVVRLCRQTLVRPLFQPPITNFDCPTGRCVHVRICCVLASSHIFEDGQTCSRIGSTAAKPLNINAGRLHVRPVVRWTAVMPLSSNSLLSLHQIRPTPTMRPTCPRRWLVPSWVQGLLSAQAQPTLTKIRSLHPQPGVRWIAVRPSECTPKRVNRFVLFLGVHANRLPSGNPACIHSGPLWRAHLSHRTKWITVVGKTTKAQGPVRIPPDRLWASEFVHVRTTLAHPPTPLPETPQKREPMQP